MFLRTSQTFRWSKALVIQDPAQPRRKRYPVDLLEVGYNAKQRGDGWVALNNIEEDDVAANYQVALEADYALRVKAYAKQDGTNSIKLTFMIDNSPIKILAVETNQEAEFVRCLADKMLTYALGRGLEYSDKCAIDKISEELTRNRYRFSSLILAIAKSTPFQMRRGDRTPERSRSPLPGLEKPDGK